MINWPAIINLVDDDELTYIASDADWLAHPEWFAVEYDDEDVLIDSKGIVYRLDSMSNEMVRPVKTDQVISLAQLVTLVQRHAAVNKTCCIEKIGFRNIEQGMAIVASLAEE